MPSLPKSLAQTVKNVAKQTGEAIVKEPLEILKTAGQQTGLTKKGDKGIEKDQSSGMTPQQIADLKKKQQDDQKKLQFYRQKLREYQQAAKQPQRPPLTEEEQEQMLAAQEAKAKPKGGMVAPPGGGSKRGTALVGRRKKGKGSGEIGAFAKRSR